ncbi:MAG: DUF1553 domain-containing protein, partial [Verrucomicrobia bacterium]|nr:DUF1553 domain-containing protein [Verrucomicrobiota bacterium]
KDPDLQMPPDGKKLSPEQVAILEEWVRRGAVDPREGKAPGPDLDAASKHWSFQPVQKPPLPAVKDASWAKTATDRFVLAALEAKNIKPSAEADRRTLLRRLSYDLTGLPPTLQEAEAFAADQSPGAYERVVERLLASPRFGERWGRHWLDVARYSDTKGTPAPIGADRRFHFAYSYRDYVIRAFNEDKPFNQFVKEQLAGDQISDSGDKSTLAALGFITVGRCFQNQIHDIIDDRIFNSSEEPKEKPVLFEPPDSPVYREYLQKRGEALAKIEEGVSAEIHKIVEEMVSKSAGYLLATQEKGADAEVKDLQTFAGSRKLVALSLSRWVAALKTADQDPVLGPWKALAALPEGGFEAKAKEKVAQWSADASGKYNPLVISVLQSSPLTSRKDVAEAFAQLFKDIEKEWADAVKNAGKDNPPAGLTDAAHEEVRLTLFKEGAPFYLSRAEADKIFSKKLLDVRTKFQDKVDLIDGEHPGAPPRAMALFDKAKPVEPVVFLRGSPGNRGPVVKRQFISFLAGKENKPFSKGSGRLELAEAIVAPSNPLTARVAVNRIWLHLFGRGLVENPNDFGIRTAPPAIPGVLDYLAATFMEGGWSTKSIVREIVRSSAYRQASAQCTGSTEDPGNDLLHAQRRRRLDYESLQDTLLLLSGSLDETVGGRPVALTKAPFPGRRSVYGYIDREDLPSVLRNFDFANPDISTGQRFETTVPQQALYLLNSPLVQNRATAIARLPEVQAAAPG